LAENSEKGKVDHVCVSAWVALGPWDLLKQGLWLASGTYAGHKRRR